MRLLLLCRSLVCAGKQVLTPANLTPVSVGSLAHVFWCGLVYQILPDSIPSR